MLGHTAMLGAGVGPDLDRWAHRAPSYRGGC